MKKILYNKLVRDRIPEIIQEAGKTCVCSPVEGPVLLNYAKKKLLEEVNEFLEDPCAEEAADVMEIFHLLCDLYEIKDSHIMAQSTAKRITKGAFAKGLVLSWVIEK
tara:strand:+ start:5420 stop:5740 length:321 start_codon:yes stop_codon:yes gene_type:complete